MEQKSDNQEEANNSGSDISITNKRVPAITDIKKWV